jgi:O-methyltransferase
MMKSESRQSSKELALEKASRLKEMLTRIGSRLSYGAIHNLDATMNYLDVGRWMREKGYHARPRMSRREELFDLVGGRVAERNVLYLEFGVYRGDATRYWSRLLRNTESQLHGFDSFEGLPEDWIGVDFKGRFSAGGQAPQIDDPRVRFFKGWFNQTLPDYKLPPHEELILILDADLYSSTIFVLNTLENAIVPGTYLYFDEFSHRYEERRAFDEFQARTGMKFSLLGATRSLAHVMFRRES